MPSENNSRSLARSFVLLLCLSAAACVLPLSDYVGLGNSYVVVMVCQQQANSQSVFLFCYLCKRNACLRCVSFPDCSVCAIWPDERANAISSHSVEVANSLCFHLTLRPAGSHTHTHALPSAFRQRGRIPNIALAYEPGPI